MGLLETMEEYSSKQAGKDAYGKKEVGATADPAAAVQGQAAAGHDAVGMRVMLQVLPPTAQHGQKADLGAKMFGIGGDAAQCSGRSLKQDAVTDPLVLQSQNAIGPEP
jgi:hypothetical protein